MKAALKSALIVSFAFLAGALRADVLSFSNSTNITIRDGDSASPYPSSLTVSGVTNLISAVAIELKGLSHGQASNVDMLLVAPSGAKYVFFADVGGTGGISAGNYMIQDGATQLPAFSLSPGTYAPTDRGTSPHTFLSPAPPVAFSGDSAAPAGTTTLTQRFAGADPNGVWSLYIMDNTSNGVGGSMSAGWTLFLTTIPGTARSTTVLQSSQNPSFTTAPSNFVIFTATVTSNNQPATQGNVEFNDGSSVLGTLALSGTGQCSLASSALAEGVHTVTASFPGTANLGSSSGTVTQTVDNHTVVNGSNFANPGAITIFDSGRALVYPSHIFVSGLTNTGVRVSLSLSNLTSPRVSDLDMLLVGPTGAKLVFFSSAGGPNAISGISAKLDDTAGSLLPGVTFGSGSYKPTSRSGGVPSLPAPAPVLTAADLAATDGTATFSSVFGGFDPNGAWSLYLADHLSGGGTSSLSGWSLAFVAVPRPILTNPIVLNTTGHFQFGFAGVPATTYSVLASSNLVNWNVLGTSSEISNGVFRFIDPQVPTNAERFYRVSFP